MTVLFTDIASYTQLAEGLDPEALRAVMARFFAQMRSVIERHEGTVQKYVGDAVMAVFGLPRMHEDDALRAVRAASDMREALARLNRDLEDRWGVTIRARTGVHTGEAFVDEEAVGTALILGDVVNTAARLQTLAQPDEILLGPDTYRLVQHAVRGDELPARPLKGKDAPVPSFRLTGMESGPHAGSRRFVLPLVGRDPECRLLGALFDTVVAECRCRLVALLGAAGAGKSRLAAEFAASVAGRATVLQGHCMAYGEAITFWPAEATIRQAAGINDDDGQEEARRKLTALLAGEPDGSIVAERCLQILGLALGVVTNDEILWTVRRLYEAVARDRPAVVILEDLHWAEPSLLDLVDHVAEWSREAPILLLCLARPELVEQRPAWSEEGAAADLIQLPPLSEDASAQITENLLGGRLGEGVLARLNAVAEGNPLYLEELLSMLVAKNVLVLRGGQWVLVRDLDDINAPLGIHALLAARIDQLGRQERQLLGVASVLGTEWPLDVLSKVLPSVGPDVAALVHQLVDKGFVRQAPSGDGDSFRFHHVLMRDAAYNGMSKQARADVHRRFAEWLETSPDERLGDYDELVGYHLERAYRCLVEVRRPDEEAQKIGRRGAERLAVAGRAAYARGDMVAACSLFSRSASLPAAPEARLQILPDLSEALMNTGEFERADAVIGEVLDAARERHDDRLGAHAQLVRSAQRVWTQPDQKLDDALREVHSTIAVFEQWGDELGLARAWRFASLLQLYFARFELGADAMDRAAGHARRAGQRRLELEALAWLPIFVWAGPTPPEPGIVRCREIVKRADGDKQVEAISLIAISTFEAMRGHFDPARMLIAEARGLLEDLGLEVWIGGPWSLFSGYIEFLAGDDRAAEERLGAGYELLNQIGETGWLSGIAAMRAQALYALGRHDEAERFTVLAEEAADPNDAYSQLAFRYERARLLARRGEIDEGERLAREAVRIAEGTDFLHAHAEAVLRLAEVLRFAGRSEEAAATVAAAAELYERKGNVVAARRVRSWNLSSPAVRRPR